MRLPAEATDEMLMVRYQRGDREAFAHLVSRHVDSVFSYAFQLLGSEKSATMVTEGAFASVVSRAAEFKHESRFTTWLFGFAHAHSVNHAAVSSASSPHTAQRSTQRQDTGGQTLDDSLSETIAGRVPPGPQRRAVRALFSLAAEHREALLLREIARLPFGEIALVTQADENTVLAHIAHALDRVQHEVGDSEEYARALR